MNQDDVYVIKEDYHGDVKPLPKKDSKKVNLSKPTDILDHRVKSQLMPSVYTNSNPPQKTHKKICLTKPEDIEKSVQSEIISHKALQEENKKKLKQEAFNIIEGTFNMIKGIFYATLILIIISKLLSPILPSPYEIPYKITELITEMFETSFEE